MVVAQHGVKLFIVLHYPHCSNFGFPRIRSFDEHMRKKSPTADLAIDFQEEVPTLYHYAILGHSYPPKLNTIERTTRFQPSTSTKSRIFSGNDTVTGGIIIMPMLINTVATTRSIRMNGTKSRKPI